MDKIRVAQVARKIEKSLLNWDIKKAIKYSDDETKTRDYLVEPFIKILGYHEMDDYSHEFSLKHSKGSVKKVDMVIFLSRREPTILIECKKSNLNLTERHFNQLNSYYEFHRESKIGILTNGIQYQFYSRSLDNNKILNKTPFMVFDVNDYNFSDIENLVKFYRQNINAIDAMTGCTVTVTHVDSRKYELKVPAGTVHGSRLKMGGLGMKIPEYGMVGYLYIILELDVPIITNTKDIETLNKIKQRNIYGKQIYR